VGRSTPTPIPSRRTTTTPVTDMEATSTAMEALGIQQERVQLLEQCQPSTEKDSWNTNAPKDPQLEAFESFKEAVKIIRICFHPEARNRALTLICTLYHNFNCNDPVLEFNEIFVEDDHWIPKKFERLMKKKKTRDFLQQEFSKNNFNIIKKTEDQCLEVKTISSSARLLFTILIQCTWVQVEILAILAVIMTQDFNQDHIETSAVLNTDYFFDIFFNHGAVTLRSDPNQGNTYSVVSHMDIDSCHQVEGSRVTQQPLQDSRTIQA
jgi:hypothetical protein